MSNIVHHNFNISKSDRKSYTTQSIFNLVYGLSGSGKSTIANALESKLNSLNVSLMLWTAITFDLVFVKT